jgi:hypothetical protein
MSPTQVSVQLRVANLGHELTTIDRTNYRNE